MKNGDPSGEKVNRVEAAMEVITTELNELLLAYKAIHWQSYHFIIHPHFTFAEEMKMSPVGFKEMSPVCFKKITALDPQLSATPQAVSVLKNVPCKPLFFY